MRFRGCCTRLRADRCFACIKKFWPFGICLGSSGFCSVWVLVVAAKLCSPRRDCLSARLLALGFIAFATFICPPRRVFFSLRLGTCRKLPFCPRHGSHGFIACSTELCSPRVICGRAGLPSPGLILVTSQLCTVRFVLVAVRYRPRRVIAVGARFHTSRGSTVA